MAKIKENGDISGKVGPVVYVNFNGRKYVRIAPGKRSKNSWSSKQVSSRKRFSEVCVFWRGFSKKPIRQIWELAAERMNGFNLFIKTNLSAFGFDGKVADLERFHVSAGKLPLPHKLRADRMLSDPEKVEVSWQDDTGNALALPNDELMMMVTHDGIFGAPISTGAVRKQETAVIQLPAGIGTIEGIYLFFASKERELYSPDQYFWF